VVQTGKVAHGKDEVEHHCNKGCPIFVLFNFLPSIILTWRPCVLLRWKWH